MDKNNFFIELVEGNMYDIPAKELEAVINSWIKSDEQGIRGVKVPGERECANDEYDEKMDEKNQIILIKRILDIVQENLEGYQTCGNLKDFYSQKGMTESFDLSKDELNKLFSLSENELFNYYQESIEISPKIDRILKFMKPTVNFSDDHIGQGKWANVITPFYDVRENSQPKKVYDNRIYINTPVTNDTYIFLSEYIIGCAKKRIDYDLKFKPEGGKDGVVLYSTDEFLEEKVEVLNDIAQKHPEIIKKFGEPPCLTGIIPKLENVNNKWCGFAHKGIGADKKGGRLRSTLSNGLLRTYNDFMDDNIDIAIMNVLLKKSEDVRRIFRNYDIPQNDIENFINFENIKCDLNSNTPCISTGDITRTTLDNIKKEYKNEFINILTRMDKNDKDDFINEFRESLRVISLMREFDEYDINNIPNVNPCIGKSEFEIYNEEKIKQNKIETKGSLGTQIREAAIKNSGYCDKELKALFDKIVMEVKHENETKIEKESKLKSSFRRAESFDSNKLHEEESSKPRLKGSLIDKMNEKESKLKSGFRRAESFDSSKLHEEEPSKPRLKGSLIEKNNAKKQNNKFKIATKFQDEIDDNER